MKKNFFFIIILACLLAAIPALSDNSFVGRTAGISLGGDDYTFTFSDPIFGPCPGGTVFFNGPGFKDFAGSYSSDCMGIIWMIFPGVALQFYVGENGLILIPEDALFFEWR